MPLHRRADNEALRRLLQTSLFLVALPGQVDVFLLQVRPCPPRSSLASLCWLSLNSITALGLPLQNKKYSFSYNCNKVLSLFRKAVTIPINVHYIQISFTFNKLSFTVVLVHCEIISTQQSKLGLGHFPPDFSPWRKM